MDSIHRPSAQTPKVIECSSALHQSRKPVCRERVKPPSHLTLGLSEPSLPAAEVRPGGEAGPISRGSFTGWTLGCRTGNEPLGAPLGKQLLLRDFSPLKLGFQGAVVYVLMT